MEIILIKKVSNKYYLIQTSYRVYRGGLHFPFPVRSLFFNQNQKPTTTHKSSPSSKFLPFFKKKSPLWRAEPACPERAAIRGNNQF
jgi:hypothetical protein